MIRNIKNKKSLLAFVVSIFLASSQAWAHNPTSVTITNVDFQTNPWFEKIAIQYYGSNQTETVSFAIPQIGQVSSNSLTFQFHPDPEKPLHIAVATQGGTPTPQVCKPILYDFPKMIKITVKKDSTELRRPVCSVQYED